MRVCYCQLFQLFSVCNALHIDAFVFCLARSTIYGQHKACCCCCIICCIFLLQAVLKWLSQRPAVHWIEPAAKLQLYNNKASSITQSGQPLPSPWSPSVNADADHHPLWAAGITGAGQVIGCGDSGVGGCQGSSDCCDYPARAPCCNIGQCCISSIAT